MKLLSFSDIIWDIYPDTAVIGGAGLNFCAHAIKCGMEGSLLSAIGKDEYGKRALTELTRLGIDGNFVRSTDFVTGKCIVSLDKSGLPSFEVLKNTAYDNISVSDEDIREIKDGNYDVLYFGTLQQRGKVSRATLKRLLTEIVFKEIFCDINLRVNCYDEESVINVLENATILKISDEELPLLDAFDFWKKRFSGKDFAEKLFDAFPQLHTVLFTLGAKGSQIIIRGQEHINIAAQKVKPVSTVGAGDSYGAAFLASILSGNSPAYSGALAAAVSAEVVSVTAAVPDYSLDDILHKYGLFCNE